MKKMLSLIVCIAIVFSFSVVSFAAGETNFTLTASATEVNEGDTFTVTLSTAAIRAASVTGGFYISEDATAEVTCTNVVDGMGYNGYISNGGPFPATCTDFATVAGVNNNGTCGFALAGTTEASFPAQNIIVATFEAVKAGTVEFAIYESTDGTDAKQADRVGTISVVIKSAAPVLDEEKTVAANPVIDDVAETKTFAVTVGADLVGTGVTAVLAHPTHGEQEVGLTFDGWTGGAKAIFDVVVKFLDFANAADTTLTLK